MRKAYTALIALGLVSLLGDVVYEGSRGAVPAFLRGLGASAFVVGAISGVGEAFNLILRFVSGDVADRTGAYWSLTIIGYVLIVSIPLLAFTGRWEIAAILILTERLGKALRSPARDVILSECCKEIGRGKAFGIHEFLDQIGAVLGPVLISAVLLISNGNYRFAFSVMFIPFFAMLFFLARARRLLGEVERRAEKKEEKFSSREFTMYVSAVGLNTLSLIPASLILYQISGEVGAWAVALVYALIQLVDAPSALLAGHVYDKIRQKMLIIPFVLSILPAPLTLLGGKINLIAAAIIFGFILGMQESVYRAFVADIVPLERRGRAYGIFNSVYGFSALGSGLIFGALLQAGAYWLAVFAYSLFLNVIGIVLLNESWRKSKPRDK
ncbi:MAG: MFS transporter [Candidatus Hadarchaeales archaeon]